MFDHRAYMLDISRDKVPTMSTLRLLVELLARFGYNQLQLYIEHTFAYSAHEAVGRTFRRLRHPRFASWTRSAR